MIAASLARRQGVAVMCAAAVGLVLWVLPSDGFDLRIFLSAARAVLHGHSPYPATDAGLASNSAFVYPRAAAWAFVPLTWFAGHTAQTVYAIVSGACLYAGVRLLGIRRALVAAPVVLSSFALRSVSLGTVEPLLFVLLAAVWRARDAQRTSGAALAVAIVLKPVVAPVWLFFVLTGRRAGAVATVVVGAGLWAAGAGLSPHAAYSYASMLRRLSSIESGHSESTVRVLGELGVGRSTASVVVVSAGLAVLVGAAAITRRRDDGEATDRAVFATAVGVCVLASPVVWSHYYLLVLVALCVVRVPVPMLYIAFAISWWVTPDRRWVVSPSHFVGWPPDSAQPWLAQLVLAMTLAACAVAATRGVGGGRPALRR